MDSADALGRFLDQLLGYVLFDVDDRFAITAIGAYLAWQGELLVMPLDEALQTASGQPSFDLAGARRDFRLAVADVAEIAHAYKHGTAR